MILSFVYSILSIFILSKKTPHLFSSLIKNNAYKKNEKKKAKKTSLHKMLTIFLGLFGIHNMYDKEYVVGFTKFVIFVNYLFYNTFLINKFNTEHQEEFNNFINEMNKNYKLSGLEKKMVNKNIIKYTIKDKTDTNIERETSYFLYSNLNDYIQREHKNFIYYKSITELLFFINVLYWFIDIILLI